MTERVKGEQMLPGDPESLLKATGQLPPAKTGWFEYLAVSVLRRADGSMTVTRIRLDPASHRVVPELLDSTPPTAWGTMTTSEILAYWANEGVLDDLDRRM